MEITDESIPNPDYVAAKYRIVGIGDMNLIHSMIDTHAGKFSKIKVQIETASELHPGRYSYVIEEL